MSESFTDNSDKRRPSSSSSDSDTNQTSCTSDEQYGDLSHCDPQRFMVMKWFTSDHQF